MTFAGTFNDGKTAASHDVAITLSESGLIITGASLAPAIWPFADIRVLDSDQAEAPLRLTLRSDDEKRLVVADAAFREALFHRASDLNPRHGRGRRIFALIAGSLAGIAVLGAALWFGLPLLAKPVAALVPQSVETRIGERVLEFLVEKRPACHEAAGEQALNRLVERVQKGAARPLALKIRIIDEQTVNAFAVPGGSIVIFSGLLNKAGSADEVAGVLAHEIGHVAHRHGMQALAQHFALSMIVTAFTGNDWGLSNAAQLLIQLAYSREAESEADATGVDMLERAGLRTDGLAAFFARIRKEDDRNALFRYLSSHPSTDQRRAATARSAQGAPVLSDDDWAALKAICKKK